MNGLRIDFEKQELQLRRRAEEMKEAYYKYVEAKDRERELKEPGGDITELKLAKLDRELAKAKLVMAKSWYILAGGTAEQRDKILKKLSK